MSTRVITPTALLSYPHLAEAQQARNGQGKAKFSASLVFTAEVLATPEGKSRYAAMQAAAIEAATTKFGASLKTPGGSIPIAQAIQQGLLKTPFRTDGVMKGYPTGAVFVNVRTERKPGLVYSHKGPDGKPAVVPAERIVEDFYPGALVVASVEAFGYDTEGNKGVSFALGNMQKVGDSARLDNRVAAEDEFTATLNEAPADLNALLGVQG